MPNCFFVTKRRWEAGDLTGSVHSLNECLERELEGPAFSPGPRIFNSNHFARFETAVAAMLSDGHMRRTSFGALFAVIWRCHPDQIWVGVLLDFNFFEHFERFGFDEALVEPLRQLGGFDAIVDALGESALKGLLAPDFEGPNSGRPTLRIADVEKVKEERWGPLKQMLLSRLKEAYEQCPKDFWARLAVSEPEDVLIRFLHDLFGNFRHPPDVAELRWKAITRDHPAYATAVLTSLEHVLQSCDDPQWLTDVVCIDAGFTSVEKGKQWLDVLLVALRTADFNALPAR
jgi:hypothetical protein